jgi:predicted DNA-binding transcriptional regulator YafY
MVLVEATVQDTQQLRWWLLGFGDQVEVVEPGELRNEFLQVAKGMIGLYQA